MMAVALGGFHGRKYIEVLPMNDTLAKRKCPVNGAFSFGKGVVHIMAEKRYWWLF